LKRAARAAALAGQLEEAERLTGEAETVEKLYHPLFGSLLLVGLIFLVVSGVVTIGAAFWPKHRVGLVVRGKTRSVTTHLAKGGKRRDLLLEGTRVQLSPLSSGQSQNFEELGSKPPEPTGRPGSGTLRVDVPGPSAGGARPRLHVPFASSAELGVSMEREELTAKISSHGPDKSHVAIDEERLRGSIALPKDALLDR